MKTCLFLNGHVRTYTETVHSVRRIRPLTNIFISTYTETDLTGYNLRKTQNATFTKVSLDDLYSKYDNIRGTRTKLTVERMSGSFSPKEQYEHLESALRFASQQNCDVSIWTRPDIYIAKNIHILDNTTIRISELDHSKNVSINIFRMAVTTTHRLSLANPKISDWFIITNNISSIYQTNSRCDTFGRKATAPPIPERRVMNSLSLSGMATRVVRNLAYLQRKSGPERCAYFCDRKPTVYPMFSCDRGRLPSSDVFDLGVIPEEWNSNTAYLFRNSFETYQFIRFDIGQTRFNTSWTVIRRKIRKTSIVVRPRLKMWDWNSFVIARHPVFERLILPPRPGLPKSLKKRLQEIAPFCDMEYYVAAYRSACDA